MSGRETWRVDKRMNGFRCHNMRATLMSAPPLMEISCAILAEILATRKVSDTG